MKKLIIILLLLTQSSYANELIRMIDHNVYNQLENILYTGANPNGKGDNEETALIYASKKENTIHQSLCLISLRHFLFTISITLGYNTFRLQQEYFYSCINSSLHNIHLRTMNVNLCVVFRTVIFKYF